MDIFPSFRIVIYPAVPSIVTEKQIKSLFLRNTELPKKCYIWEFQDQNFVKATFAQEISNTEYFQDNNGFCLILTSVMQE